MFRAAWNYRRFFPGCEVAALCRQLVSKFIHSKLIKTCKKNIAAMLKAIHAQEDREVNFPYEHWTRLRTNNALERIMKEIRRRTRIIGAFPDGYSAMMLVGARLRHISTTK